MNPQVGLSDFLRPSCAPFKIVEVLLQDFEGVQLTSLQFHELEKRTNQEVEREESGMLDASHETFTLDIFRSKKSSKLKPQEYT